MRTLGKQEWEIFVSFYFGSSEQQKQEKEEEGDGEKTGHDANREAMMEGKYAEEEEEYAAAAAVAAAPVADMLVGDNFCSFYMRIAAGLFSQKRKVFFIAFVAAR